MRQDSLNRRNLLKKFAMSAPIAAATMAAMKAYAAGPAAAPAAGKPELKLVPDTDGTAKALKYVHDASKATRPDKAGVKGAEQKCSNCQFYSKAGDVGGKEAGKCLMIQGGLVLAEGWCVSWTKKA
jgi:hypothetical protein